MPAGFQVINDHYTVLIDENYHNLAITAQGSLTFGPTGQASIPAIPAGEQLAIRSGALCAVSGNSLSGTPGDTVQWYRFGRPASTATAGLQVFDALGRMTFCATLKYARVVGTYSGSPSDSYSVSLPAGRDYAVVMAKRGFAQTVVTRPYEPHQPAPPYAFDATIDVAGSRVTGSSAVIGWVRVAEFDNLGQPVFIPPDSFADVPTTFHVVDVTGY